MDADGLVEDLLNDLTPAQLEAVTSTDSPLCILAGAGSGKTRVLTRRIAHRVAAGTAEPAHVMAVTFTRKAAGELHDRLQALGIREHLMAGTFHGIAYGQLRSLWADRGHTPPKLLDRKIGVIARLLGSTRAADPLDVVTEVEWAAARMLEPDAYPGAAAAAGRRIPLDGQGMVNVLRAYDEHKRRQRLIDFDDLLLRCLRELESDPEFVARQRWRFRHFFVDEFQDVNPLQFALLRTWLGDRSDLCVVGDPNQAIYSWNGADASYLRAFERHFPGAGTASLAENHRSTRQIVAVANAVLRHAGGLGMKLRPTLTAGDPPTVTAHATDRDEATAIARAVREARGTHRRWSDQAVLVRTNAQTALIAQALGRVDVPHRVRGGGALLQQPEVRKAMDGLRRSASPFEVALVDLAAELDGPIEGEEAAADAEETLGEEERKANVAALVRLARTYVADEPTPSFAGFQQWLAAGRGDDAPNHDAVDVATFHAAKGLEWPVVHLAGLEAGLVPISYARTIAASEEEQRLFYVAVTRAERQLHCHWASQRTFGTRAMSRDRSPYLDAVELVVATERGEPPTNVRARIARDRRRLQAARSPGDAEPLSSDDQHLFEALRAWRLETARAADVPAYVIFPDRTLRAVATSRPSDHQDLLALPGVGKVKASRYGDDLLSMVSRKSATSGA